MLNSDFENGLDGWGKADTMVFQIKTDGANKYLAIAAEKRAELAQKITSLVPGQNYTLSFAARCSTFADARVILRNPNGAKYIGTASPAKDAAWQKQTLRFVAPGPEVGLEISLRSPGRCDLDGFTIEKAN